MRGTTICSGLTSLCLQTGHLGWAALPAGHAHQPALAAGAERAAEGTLHHSDQGGDLQHDAGEKVRARVALRA